MIEIEFSEYGVICRQNDLNDPGIRVDHALSILAGYCQREYLPLPDRRLAERFFFDVLQTIPVETAVIPWNEIHLWLADNARHCSQNSAIQNTA